MKNFYFTLIFIFFNLFLTAQNTTGSSAEVGKTSGNLSVSLTGAANYAIPIAAPPGINGVVPKISLSYNSQGGIGSAGYGWNISGVSSITRISATKFHDGIIDPIDFDNLDRFAIDGQRLIVKNATDVYGANGTVYETENFSNIKVTSYGVNPNGSKYGPAYFLVEYPDGSKAYYGNSADSRSATSWSVTNWDNPLGVRISYTYSSSNNTLNIASIKYGSITTAQPINEIKFVYKNRTKQDQVYVGGETIIRTNILSEINVLSSGVGFRNYLLEHDLISLRYERLISITEKNGDKTKSYNPTVFTYDTTEDNIVYTPSTSLIPASVLANNYTITGDFDGNGRTDIVPYSSDSTSVHYKNKFWVCTNLDVQALSKNWQVDCGNFEDIVVTTWLTAGNQISPLKGITVIQKQPGTQTFSFNTYAVSANNVTLQYSKQADLSSIPDIKSKCSKKYIRGDFNGDGLSDILVFQQDDNGLDGVYYTNTVFIDLDRRKTSNFSYNSGSLVTVIDKTDRIETGDVNGDGKTDVLHFFQGRVIVYSLNANNQLEVLTDLSNIEINPSSVIIGDFNGDKKTDFFSFYFDGTDTQGVRYMSVGSSFNGISDHLYFYPTYDLRTRTAQDVDNDGKSDIVEIYNGFSRDNGLYIVFRIFKSNGQGFEAPKEKSFIYDSFYLGAASQSAPLFYESANPNYGFELVTTRGSAYNYFQFGKNIKTDATLKKIQCGDGKYTSITYKPLQQNSDTNIYTPSINPEVYPNMEINLAPNFKVVYQVEDGTPGEARNKIFTYYGATSNVEGLGFLGFKETMTSSSTGLISESISNISKFDMSRHGANIENYSVKGIVYPTGIIPSVFITKSILSYNSPSDALQGNKVFKLQNTGIKNFNSLYNTSEETTIDYDQYSNPLKTTTDVKENSSIVQTAINTITYETVSSSPYIVGRPSGKVQSISLPGVDNTSSEELYSYNSNQLLSQVKKKGDATTNYVTEDNTYDSFGNITQKKITAGTDVRISNYEYDSSGRFLSKITDPEGLVNLAEYNPNGTLKSETNSIGQKTSYEYDSWFKKVKITDYLQKSIVISYINNSGTYFIRTTGDDGKRTEEKFNSNDWKLYSATNTINDVLSYLSYTYDNVGKIIQTDEPGFTFRYNKFTYDVYGRIVKKVLFTGKTIDITYNGLTTIESDGVKSKSTTKNAIGNVVSMTDTPGGTVDYVYYANGNLKESNYGGVKTTITQDGWGRKTQLTDPSAGVYKYTYNNFNEIITEETPNGITNYSINSLGRLNSKTITDPIAGKTNSSTVYTYDSDKQLTKSVFTDVISNMVITTLYDYDIKKRLSQVTETNSIGSVFTKNITFDAFGRPDVLTNTAQLGSNSIVKTQNTYKNGYLWQIKDYPNTKVLWENKDTNTRGQLVSAALGNGITISNTYDNNGYVNKMQHDLGVNTIMKHETTFDGLRGNLLNRNNSFFGIKETFDYDELDRLIATAKDDVFMNYNFNTGTSTEGFQADGGATTNVSGSALSTQATAAGSGVKKTLAVGASIGDKISLSFNVIRALGSDVLNIYIQEQNPGTGVIVKYLKTAQTTSGLISFTHTVTQNTTIILKIEKANTTGMNVFTVDNVVGIKPVKIKQDYDNRGKILKNAIGDYNYADADPQKLYRNTSVTLTPEALTYYQGKQTQNITYNTFKSPIQIDEAGIDKVSFVYNDNNGRSIMFSGGTQNDKLQRKYRKYYSAFGDMEIKQDISTGGVTEFVTYIGGNPYTAPLLVKSNGSVPNYLYLHRDYQGSILAITNQAGAVVEKRLFDAWGEIIKVQDGSGTALTGLTVLDRGYTGHEHLQSVGLINMNGRLYDNKLHRFLQPDNNIQDPSNTQNFNRYSYCLNNPTSYTDPTGEDYEDDPPTGMDYEDGQFWEDKFGKWQYNRETWTWMGLNGASDVLNAVALDEVLVRGNSGSSSSNLSSLSVGSSGSFSGITGSIDHPGGDNWATGTLAFITTDIMIPEPTDAAWPKWAGYAVAATVASAYLYSGDYYEKMTREIDRIHEKTAGPPGFVYELRVNQSNNYRDVRGNNVYLNAGDVWKYGETTSGMTRYSQRELDNMIPGGTTMQPIYFGNQVEIKIQEKIMIYGYFFLNETLPPGNKIFR